ncbi:MAG: hypothetical protein ACWA5A_14875 [Marinibacterium sp.]
MRSFQRLGKFSAAALFCAALHLTASQTRAQSASEAAQANNPLANFRSIALQNYYMGKLTGTSNKANQFWMRYAQPLADGKWILRLSLPVNSLPTGPGGAARPASVISMPSPPT